MTARAPTAAPCRTTTPAALQSAGRFSFPWARGYLSARLLVKYFRTRTLLPFAIDCIVVGLGSIFASAW